MPAIARRMSRILLSRWENLIYIFGFRHHTMAVGDKHNQREEGI